MDAIKNRDGLLSIEEECLRRQKSYQCQVLVCDGAECISSNCKEVRDVLIKLVSTYELDDGVRVMVTGCMDTCAMSLIILTRPEEISHARTNPERAEGVVVGHLLEDEICEEYTYFNEDERVRVPRIEDVPSFKGRVRVALRNCGHMEYASLEAYISRDGYGALVRALSEITPAQVAEEMKAAGFKGRGSAGLPTGTKWEAGMKAMSEDGRKLMIYNVDEGDPGVFIDRDILESDPYSITESMMLGGYATEASRSYVYVRIKYPIVVERLDSAIDQARKTGILGENMMGSGFSSDLEIRTGAGAFVYGEKTSLLASIEGKGGELRQKSSFLFEEDLFESPTIINNTETLANAVPVIPSDSQWYRGFGTEKSVGTKVSVLAGDIVNVGITEVSMSTILGDTMYKIGGGVTGGKKFKATQSGGPSGGCLTEIHLNTPVDYGSLSSLRAIMGSSGLIVMNEDTCMVGATRYLMDFICDESCGKCLPCCNGTRRMLEMLEYITEGKGQPEDLELLRELAGIIQQTAMCDLGQTAPNPVLSTPKYFRGEYEARIYEKHCSTGACAELQTLPYRNTCPANVFIPEHMSLLAAGRTEDMCRLIRQDSPFLTVCGRVYIHPCEDHCQHAQVDEPLAIHSARRFIGDYALRGEYNVPPVEPRSTTGKCISVIGADPSGLTCAYYLANMGHEVYVYEPESVAGGVLYWGILEYRLPKAILQKEIHVIERSGMQIHLSARIGPDITFEDVKKQSDAVYVASKIQVSRLLDMPGEDLKDMESGLGFLECVGLKKDISVPNKLVVTGGGSTTMNAARTTVRLGTSEVAVAYRRSEKKMPVGKDEIIEARGEGTKLIATVPPVEFLGANGEVTGIHLVRRKETDYGNDGRRCTVHIPDSGFFLECDGIVAAVNQGVGHQVYRTTHVEVAKNGKLDIGRFTPETGESGVFAGDDVSPWSTNVVVHVIMDGRKAAMKVDQYLEGKGELSMSEWFDIPKIVGTKVNESYKRFSIRCLSMEERRDNFREMNCGFHKPSTMDEALRCLHCDRRQEIGHDTCNNKWETGGGFRGLHHYGSG